MHLLTGICLRSFNEMAKLVDPGKEPKTDKSSILSDGIKVIQQLRVENNQLRQLNKFLEVSQHCFAAPLFAAADCMCVWQERVAQYERGRRQQLFQLASMHQQPAAALTPPLQPGVASLPPQMVTGGLRSGAYTWCCISSLSTCLCALGHVVLSPSHKRC